MRIDWMVLGSATAGTLALGYLTCIAQDLSFGAEMYRTWAALRAGGLRRATADLGISHAPLRRRLQQLEEELGLSLFDRRPSGLHATPQARELVGLAEQAEVAVRSDARRGSGLSASLEGPIQVSAPDLLVSNPRIRLFRKAMVAALGALLGTVPSPRIAPLG